MIRKQEEEVVENAVAGKREKKQKRGWRSWCDSRAFSLRNEVGSYF